MPRISDVSKKKEYHLSEKTIEGEDIANIFAWIAYLVSPREQHMARIDLAVSLDSVNAFAPIVLIAPPALVSRPDADIPAPNIPAPDHPPE